MKLIIEDDEGRKTVVPFVRDEITIGRQEGNTIRLTERNVSRRHARLLRQSGQVLIEDCNSYNGIRINGDRIAGQVQVSDGDLIQIGDYDLAIQAEETAQAATLPMLEDTQRSTMAATARLPEPSSATMPHLPTVTDMPQASDADVQDDDGLVGSDPAPEAPKHQSTAVIRVDQVEGSRKRKVVEIDAHEAPRLVVLNTELQGREFMCVRTEIKLGRTDDNDVPLDHRSVSATHCKLVREENGDWRVIDLQSANGLMVNGEPYAQATLRFGDTLELGHLKIQFVGPGDSPSLPTSTSQVTSEAATGSRAPIIAIVVAVLVVILGGGGYAFWKSRPVEVTHRDPVRPPPKEPANDPVPEPIAVKDPVKAADPEPVKPEAVKPEPVKPEPARVAEPDPAEVHRVAEQKVAEARAAIEALDFKKAEGLLKSANTAEAKQLLAEMDNEKSNKRNLEGAEEALDQKDTERAGVMLQSARDTRLLKARYKDLDDRRAALVKERLAEKANEKKNKPPRGGAGAPDPRAQGREEDRGRQEERRGGRPAQGSARLCQEATARSGRHSAREVRQDRRALAARLLQGARQHLRQDCRPQRLERGHGKGTRRLRSLPRSGPGRRRERADRQEDSRAGPAPQVSAHRAR